MLDKRTYISQVRNQLDGWKSDLQDLARNSDSGDFQRFNDAMHLVENKVNEFEITGDEALGQFETEIDNLRHQTQRILESARQ